MRLPASRSSSRDWASGILKVGFVVRRSITMIKAKAYNVNSEFAVLSGARDQHKKANKTNWIKRQETLISRTTAVSQKPNLIKQTFERQAITNAFDGRKASVSSDTESSLRLHSFMFEIELSTSRLRSIKPSDIKDDFLIEKRAIEWQSAVSFFLPERKSQRDNFIEETLRLSVPFWCSWLLYEKRDRLKIACGGFFSVQAIFWAVSLCPRSIGRLST